MGFNTLSDPEFSPPSEQLENATRMLVKCAEFHYDINELRQIDLTDPEMTFYPDRSYGPEGFVGVTKDGFMVKYGPNFDQARGYPHVKVLVIYSPTLITDPEMQPRVERLHGREVFQFAYYLEQQNGQQYGPPQVSTRKERTFFNWPPR